MADMEKSKGPDASDNDTEIAKVQESLEGVAETDLGATALGGPEEVIRKGDYASLKKTEEGLVVEINPPAPGESS